MRAQRVEVFKEFILNTLSEQTKRRKFKTLNHKYCVHVHSPYSAVVFTLFTAFLLFPFFEPIHWIHRHFIRCIQVQMRPNLFVSPFNISQSIKWAVSFDFALLAMFGLARISSWFTPFQSWFHQTMNCSMNQPSRERKQSS